nr:hypothetical protein [Tanacetum cinerariifolium]
MIIADADNRPPMLEKSLYYSWKTCMEFHMENKENGRIILDLVQNDQLVWPTVIQEDGTTRKNTYAELSATEKLQADCDCKATNIVLQGLPPDVTRIQTNLDEEQLAFLPDPGILDGQAAQTTTANTADFQTEDHDAYDSDCDDVSNAKVVLMANLSNNGSDVILE